MDLIKVLGELYAERQRLTKIIDTLEALHGQAPEVAPKRRGRKYMDPAARKAVSARMKKYWAARRAAGQGPDSASPKNGR